MIHLKYRLLTTPGHYLYSKTTTRSIEGVSTSIYHVQVLTRELCTLRNQVTYAVYHARRPRVHDWYLRPRTRFTSPGILLSTYERIQKCQLACLCQSAIDYAAVYFHRLSNPQENERTRATRDLKSAKSRIPTIWNFTGPGYIDFATSVHQVSW
jgi:hypothetical protein